MAERIRYTEEQKTNALALATEKGVKAASRQFPNGAEKLKAKLFLNNQKKSC